MIGAERHYSGIGRWGLFSSHVQDASAHRDFSRIDFKLGEHWESCNSSFKPFPAAHVIHPYIDAAIRLRERYYSTRGY
ncbi:MAG: MmgE/PrpD family protein [Bryobacterales bacterium]|nr:MmgE/PrpD family protein [Bryobacterales bacterium]